MQVELEVSLIGLGTADTRLEAVHLVVLRISSPVLRYLLPTG